MIRHKPCRTPLNEWSARRRGRYKHNRKIFVYSAGFETSTQQSSDHTATGLTPHEFSLRQNVWLKITQKIQRTIKKTDEMKPQRYVERLIAKVSCCVRNLSWRQADVCTVRVSLLCVVAINRLLQTIITDNGTTVSATEPATSLCTIYMLSCNSPRRKNSEITLHFES
jgi:hypothetical protein